MTKDYSFGHKLERYEGVEPSPGRWKRLMLPLNTNIAITIPFDRGGVLLSDRMRLFVKRIPAAP